MAGHIRRVTRLEPGNGKTATPRLGMRADGRAVDGCRQSQRGPDLTLKNPPSHVRCAVLPAATRPLVRPLSPALFTPVLAVLATCPGLTRDHSRCHFHSHSYTVPLSQLHSSTLTATQFHSHSYTVPLSQLHSSTLKATQFHSHSYTVPHSKLHSSTLTVPHSKLHSSTLTATQAHTEQTC